MTLSVAIEGCVTKLNSLTVLGPLLFLIYIDSLANVPIADGTRMVLYADDLLLFPPITKQYNFQTLHAK